MAFSVLGALSGIIFVFSQSTFMQKAKNLLKSSLNLLKPQFKFPHEGENTSVETALNSRCTSDYDGNSLEFHWGQFDRWRELSAEQIEYLISLAKIPRFTDQKVEIQAENNVLTFVVESRVSSITREWLMVESGMQQQALALICSALGVGLAFRGIGEDGTPISDAECATIRARVDPMKPSYNRSFWSCLPPSGEPAWLKGNLSDPDRDGGRPLISILSNLKIEKGVGLLATDKGISQLLWAARGRTPHYYLSKPWGMTIPTAHGKQNTSCVYLVSENKVYRYVNWHKNRPTHSLELLGEIDADLYNELIKLFPLNNCFIMIGKDRAFAIALWEVGYQLLNLLLQAHALGVAYHAALFDETHKIMLRRMPIKDLVAILVLKRQSNGTHFEDNRPYNHAQ